MRTRAMILSLLPGLLLCPAGGCGDDDGGNHNHGLPVCGNRVLEAGELCDIDALDGQTCVSIGQGYDGGELACAAGCQSWDTGGCTASAQCGDGTLDTEELCDGVLLGGQTCVSIGQGYDGGELACAAGCQSWDTSGCSVPAPCGNGALDAGELCDGAELGGQTCVSIGQGYDGGELACAAGCQTWDTSNCTVDPLCSNGTLDPGEVCDGTNLDGQDCTTLGMGYVGGTLACAPNCVAFRTDGCLSSGCGNQVLEGGELCDGIALGGQTCAGLGMGFSGGTLACSVTCDGWDVTGCTTSSHPCGDGIIDPGEACDGTALGGMTCVALVSGSLGGTPTCRSDCQGWDTATCIVARCGNGVVEGDELCDGADHDGQDCTTIGMGYTGGTLACRESCHRWEVSGCTGGTPVCGNGYREAGELCDLTDVGSARCADFGYGDGALACNHTCDGYLIGGCKDRAGYCGDGQRSGWEICDGEDDWDMTCEYLGFSGGTLTCTPQCTLDTSGCIGDRCAAEGLYGNGYCDPCPLVGGSMDPDCLTLCPVSDGICVSYRDWWFTGPSTCVLMTGSEDPDCGTCGDGITDFDVESCDGAGPYDLSCVDLDFAGGTMGCTANCQYDLSGCQQPVCGDGVVEGPEECDGANLNGESCDWIGVGFNAGQPVCSGDCYLERGTCAFACDAVDLGTFAGAPIQVSGNSCNDHDAYNPFQQESPCAMPVMAWGPDAVYRLTLPAATSVTVHQVCDMTCALYVIRDCADTAARTCVAGADHDGYAPDQETLTLSNPAPTAQTYFIVADGHDCGPYTLEID